MVSNKNKGKLNPADQFRKDQKKKQIKRVSAAPAPPITTSVIAHFQWFGSLLSFCRPVSCHLQNKKLRDEKRATTWGNRDDSKIKSQIEDLEDMGELPRPPHGGVDMPKLRFPPQLSRR